MVPFKHFVVEKKGLDCGFVENVHKLCGALLEFVGNAVDAGSEIVVGKHSYDADNKSCDSGYQSGVDAS